jgi:hypothetical protein
LLPPDTSIFGDYASGLTEAVLSSPFFSGKAGRCDRFAGYTHKKSGGKTTA